MLKKFEKPARILPAKFLSTTWMSKNAPAADALIAELEKDGSAAAKEILEQKAYLPKKSVWIFGGLDHVLASGENINVMVFDTEM